MPLFTTITKGRISTIRYHSEVVMRWYFVHTKPTQEKRTLEKISSAKVTVLYARFRIEKLRRGVLTVADELLFLRYLFV